MKAEDGESLMRGRWGLQAKMTASYVLVTAAAVVLVEVVVLGFVVPGLLSRADLASLVQRTAGVYADEATTLTSRLGRLPTAEQIQLGDLGNQPARGDDVIDIPYIAAGRPKPEPVPVALLLAPDGRVVASSYPVSYPVGVPVGAGGAVPAEVRDQPPQAWGKRGFGGSSLEPTATPNGEVLWAARPVFDIVKPREAGAALLETKQGKLPPSEPLGFLYVQVPASLEPPGADPSLSSLAPLLGIGLLVLVAAVPVGLVFGLLSTRRLAGRVRRLAATTLAVAGGDLQQRVPVSGRDEVAQLEDSFNRMAGRLAAAMATERQLASATERARIARELHDAISQDLFSLRLLAGGLRKALPAGSPLRPQVETMEQTATATMHEMQALLLELRPVALEDAGLVPALEELCHAYRERLGVTVDADLEPVQLDPPVEHAVLRVVQEALANAVKHSRPNRVVLRLARRDGQLAVDVEDDGGGFDPARAVHRHGFGLGLMRERVAELGGTFQLESTPGQGTNVRIRLPERQA